MTSPHSAYELVSDTELPEYRARGILFRHRKTGCEVYRVVTEDRENVFAFTFRTGPSDETGVAHIIEHSVLCGSERYPVKEPFLAMIRRSLATFMNAFTYPDKTVYPAASAVEADYFNLLDIYGDAVFHPRLSEDTFLQEAHHLEFAEDGRLDVRGVVYNEMRGDYSSGESLAGTACSTSLFSPGHPYSFDSGGNPEHIPSLDYAAFRKFWEEHYHPSNCRIFLYGDIDTERQLEHLDRRFLGAFEARPVHSEIPLEPRTSTPSRIEVPYPLAEGGEAATSIIVNWLTIPVTDGVESLAMEVLSEILLGHDGSALAKELRDSGLGEDLSPQCGIDTGFRQILFSAGLRGATRGDEGRIENLILDTLRRQIETGFSPESLDAAFHSIAFSNREIRRGSGAYGLRLYNRSIRGWLHGAPPEATLSFETPFTELKSRLATNPRYLEELAARELLGNGHRRTVTVYPDPGLLERRREARDAELAAKAAALSPEERERLRVLGERLAAGQAARDSPEAIATLPRLAVSDLPHSIEIIPRMNTEIDGIRASLHPQFTNGIVYLDLAFPLDLLPRRHFLWLPLLTRFISGAGLPNQPYHKVAEALARNAGAFSAMLESSTPATEAQKPAGERTTRSFVIFRLKALVEKFPTAVRLALSLIRGADYGDIGRIGDLYAELRNDVVSALIPAGHSFAQARAGAFMSDALAAEELWRGPSQLRFLLDLKNRRTEEIAASLRAAAAAIVGRRGARINLSAESGALDGVVRELGLALEASGLPGEAEVQALPIETETVPQERFEAYSLSAQVGFTATASRASALGSAGYAHETVLAHLLTTGALWEEIRMRQGAYGASCSADGLEALFSFSSYRDPRPVESLGYFPQALAQLHKRLGPEETDEAIVGAVGRDLRPLLPEERSITDFRRELYDISDDLRAAKREDLLSTRREDVLRAAESLASRIEAGSEVLFSRAEDVEAFKARRPSASVYKLPL